MSKISKIFEDDSDDFEESDSSYDDSDDYEDEQDEQSNDEDEEGEDENKIEDEVVDDEADDDEIDTFEDDDDDEYKDAGEDVKEEESEVMSRLTKKSKRIIELQKLQQVKDNKKCLVISDFRDKSITFIKKLVNNDTKADKLEKSLFNYCVRTLKNEGVKGITLNSKAFRERYSTEVYKLMSSIKSKKNIDDIKDEYDNTLSYFDRKIFEKEKQTDLKKLRLITHVNEPVSGIHKCKCGCEKVYSYELQTRSGDEGMTVFLQCSDCGKKWKM